MFGECFRVEFIKFVEIFDIEVYALHSEGIFFKLYFINYIFVFFLFKPVCIGGLWLHQFRSLTVWFEICEIKRASADESKHSR